MIGATILFLYLNHYSYLVFATHKQHVMSFPNLNCTTPSRYENVIYPNFLEKPHIIILPKLDPIMNLSNLKTIGYEMEVGVNILKMLNRKGVWIF